MTKSLWNFDFKNDYKTIYSLSENLIELWLISDWLEKWGYLMTKSLWNLDFKNDYKTIYSLSRNLIELWLISDWLEKWGVNVLFNDKIIMKLGF